jgi:Holliday junction resolvase
MAEKSIVDACVRELDRRRAYHFNVHGHGAGRNGLPDIVACHLGRWISIECKAPRGRLRPLQIFELEQAARAGGYTLVCRDVAQLRALLDEIEAEDLAAAA